jgi:hypothetical protein
MVEVIDADPAGGTPQTRKHGPGRHGPRKARPQQARSQQARSEQARSEQARSQRPGDLADRAEASRTGSAPACAGSVPSRVDVGDEASFRLLCPLYMATPDRDAEN